MSSPQESGLFARRRNPSIAQSRRTRLALEQLEDRAVPAVFNVNSLADILNPAAGVVTLRSAIEAANNTPGGNTINLTLGGNYKLQLAGTPGETDNHGGELAINSTGGDLNIVNTSGQAVTVSGNPGSRVFDVNPAFDPANPTAKFLVTMDGFTITKGFAAPGDAAAGSGGGIRDQGNASLTLNNMVVTGNLATADGGGVAMENGVSVPWTLTLNNSTISNNRAGDAGGGIETDGSGKVIIASSTITGNTSVNQGAGVWLDAIQVGTVFQGASLNMTDTEVASNHALSAGGFGGGIGNAGNGAVTIQTSTIENNTAGANGGGFGDENAQGTLTVINSTILNNSATGDGGGIAAGGPSTTLTNDEIDGNTSGGNGGGVLANGAKLFVQSSTLANNVAGNGGGIEVETTGTGLFNGSTIINTTLTGNTALNNAGGTGGGINLSAAFTGDLQLMNDTINGNTAVNGGGLFWTGTGNVGVQNTIIAGNTAPTAPDVSTNEFYTAILNGAQQVPPSVSTGSGTGSILLNPDQGTIAVNISTTGLLGTITAQHLHNAPAGANGPLAQDADGNNIELGTANPATANFTVNAAFVSQLQAGNIYTNIHTTLFPAGEIRGQFSKVAGSFTDMGGNLIGVAGAGSGNTLFTNASTQTGTVAIPLDPLLGPLQDNGGPTIGATGHTMTLQTMAPLAGSPVIGNGILPGAPATDERGFASIVNGAINVGAVSSFVPTPPAPPPPPPTHHHHHPYLEYLEGLCERVENLGLLGWTDV